MSSIPAFRPNAQEGPDNSPILSYRYAFRVTPDQVSRMDREQLQQLCLEQLYILTIIITVIRNPLAAMASRIVAVDQFIAAIEKNVQRKIASITERSRVYISGEGGVARRLGIHPNTVSKSFKSLETFKQIKRDYTFDEKKDREYLDITLAALITTPAKLQDKTIRKMAEAGKNTKQKAPDGIVSSPETSLSCPSCGEMDNLQVTCRTCGTVGSPEEFAEGPQGDAGVLLRAEVQDVMLQRLSTLSQPQATVPESMIVEATLTEVAEIPNQKEDATLYYTNFVQSSNNAPLRFTQIMSPGAQIATWLEKRIGREQGARIIFATGSPTTEKKYMAKPATYQPDIRKYIKADLDHIYGSYLGKPDGTTYVLSFDFDSNEAPLDAQHEDLLKQLAAAGAAPIYWQRQNNRGHLELYFDQPVNANQAREWVMSACPALATVQEIYPALDKQNSPISWPFWQRKGNEILACTGKVALPSAQDQIITINPTERRTLAMVLEAAVTPASLIPPAPEPEPQPEKPATRPAEQMSLNFDQSQQLADRDVAKLVIEEFNRTTSWEDLIDQCGGTDRNGKFVAVWRGERTPSCKVDANERAACDYGRINNGAYPKKFDKYQLWLMLEDVDKRADLARRCKEYRERQAGVIEQTQDAPRELRQSEQERIDQAQESQEPEIFPEILEDPAILAILETSASRETEYSAAKPCTKCGCTFTYNLSGSRACCLCYPFKGMSELDLYNQMRAYSVKVKRFN